MRQIVLDTETTGLEPAEGHRVIEIGCVELVSRDIAGRVPKSIRADRYQLNFWHVPDVSRSEVWLKLVLI
jgi:DNA polymerase III epsilon subunit-like protein